METGGSSSHSLRVNMIAALLVVCSVFGASQGRLVHVWTDTWRLDAYPIINHVAITICPQPNLLSSSRLQLAFALDT